MPCCLKLIILTAVTVIGLQGRAELGPESSATRPVTNITATGVPSIVCDVPIWDVGQQSSIQSVSHVFVLRNAGTGTLFISNAWAGCGCAAVRIDSYQLEPGQTTTLSATLVFQVRKGKQRKTIYVASNDPATPYLRLEVSSTLVLDVEADPDVVEFGLLDRQGVAQREVRLVSNDNVSFHITGVRSSSPLFECALVTNEQGRAYLLKVHALGPRPTGISRAVLEVSTDHPRLKSLSIPVTAHVAGEVMAVPPNLIMIGSMTGRTQRVSVYAPSGSPFRILEVEPPDPKMTVVLEPVSPSRYSVRVDYAGAVSDTLHGTCIRLATDCAACQEVVIPIRVISPLPRGRGDLQ